MIYMVSTDLLAALRAAYAWAKTMEMKSAHESESIRRAAGAESPTFDTYSATGAEKLKWASKSMGNGGSLMISRLARSVPNGPVCIACFYGSDVRSLVLQWCRFAIGTLGLFCKYKYQRTPGTWLESTGWEPVLSSLQ